MNSLYVISGNQVFLLTLHLQVSSPLSSNLDREFSNAEITILR